MPIFQTQSHPRPRRGGAAMLAAIVALGVVTVILFYALSGTLDVERQMRSHRQAVQADLLAAAGIERAKAKLAAGDDYDGETWSVPADELDGQPAEVVIRVTPADEDAASWQITAEATYPAGDSPFRNQKTRQATAQKQ